MGTRESKAGGRREGAGRKPLSDSLEKTTRLSVCLTESQAKTFKAKGGAKWLRRQIEKSSLPAESLFPTLDPAKQSAPLFSSYVQAGFPNVAESHIDKSLDLNETLIKNASATFFVRVSGDSMNKAGMDDGDLLIVDRSMQAHNNDIVIMRIDDEFTVKRLHKENGSLYLSPESHNSIYKPIYPKQGEEWALIGVVTYTIKKN